MRLVWAGFLMTGLLLIGFSVFESRQEVQGIAPEEGTGLMHASEDGGSWPPAGPTPPPKSQN